jgi:protein-S-isoprenylcysteine O-methyltransferase Ste14
MAIDDRADIAAPAIPASQMRPEIDEGCPVSLGVGSEIGGVIRRCPGWIMCVPMTLPASSTQSLCRVLPMKVISYINLHKVLVPPVVLAMMWYFSNWSTEAFVYLSLHGTYAMLWLIKEEAYPDRRFQEVQPIWIGFSFIFLPLAGYYIAPYLLISRHVVLPPWVFGLAISIFTLGIFLHFVSDAQKFYTLRIQKGLIEDGLFSHTRNPNYLGEILIYLAYAILSWHWLPFLVLAGWLFGFFVRNMLAKDKSMSRHAGFAAYKARTGMFFPKFGRVSPARTS